MNKAVEVGVGFVVLLVTLIYRILEAIVLFFVPTSARAKDVRGQNVLITGAGSGLGQLMAVRFAELGCTLILWDINERGNAATAERVKEQGAPAFTYTVDVSSREKIYNAAEQVKKDVGKVDILINNAGVVTGKKFLDSPDHLIQRTMDININAHFWTCKAFLPDMIAQDRGHIVNIASSAGLFGVTGLVDYCASKYAAVGFDEALRTELYTMGKHKSIYTTVICPFFINTGMFDGVQSKLEFLLPILEPDYVIDKIMSAVLTNQQVLYIPRIVYWLALLKSMLPSTTNYAMGDFAGLNNFMDVFVGRGKSD